jgi:hypothetical protein
MDQEQAWLHLVEKRFPVDGDIDLSFHGLLTVFDVIAQTRFLGGGAGSRAGATSALTSAGF